MTIVVVPNEKNRNGNTTKIDKKVGNRCILLRSEESTREKNQAVYGHLIIVYPS
ncbi:hypothetical protein KWN52_000579 [Enterococcus hirae]|nr:hypothetical protein [Enterococcus hirae]